MSVSRSGVAMAMRPVARRDGVGGRYVGRSSMSSMSSMSLEGGWRWVGGAGVSVSVLDVDSAHRCDALSKVSPARR
jgi:hypothetical protein